MTQYRFTINSIIPLEDSTKEDAENTFLAMIEEGAFEYVVTEVDPDEDNEVFFNRA